MRKREILAFEELTVYLVAFVTICSHLSPCLLVCWLPASLIRAKTSSISPISTIYCATGTENSHDNTCQIETRIRESHRTKSAMMSALVEVTDCSR